MNSDNAGGGLRGLRAAPSPELFEAIHKHYRIDASSSAVDLGGSSSLNLLVHDKQERYVVRVYRPYVTEARMRAIHRARSLLSSQGVPCPKVIVTQAGQSWLPFAGRLVEVEHYVDHDAGMNSWERLQSGLPLLGRIHTLLRPIAVGSEGRRPLFTNHIEPLDALPRTRQGTQRIHAWNPSPEERHLADAADALAQLVSQAESALVPLLPRQLVHGDFWNNNVLFQNGEIVLIADFDFMGERARINDLALTLYFTVLDLASIAHGVSDEVLARLGQLVDAYNSGLDDPLTTIERAALPLAIARQPLWSIGGWVALLDDEEAARQHAAGMGTEVALGLRIIQELDRWQAAFA